MCNNKVPFFKISLLASMATIPSIAMTAPLTLSHVALNENLQPNIQLVMDDSSSVDAELLTSGQWNLGSYLTGFDSEKMTGDGIYASLYPLDNCPEPASFIQLFDNADNRWTPKCSKALYEAPKVMDADWRLFSSDFNTIYYNPRVNYRPWPGYDDANFENARSHPSPTQPGYNDRTNLGNLNFRFSVWNDTAGWSGNRPNDTNANRNPNGVVDLWDNFTQYVVKNASIDISTYSFQPQSGRSCSGTATQTNAGYLLCFNGTRSFAEWNEPFGRTIKEEQQNIANWYQYHRRRSFALRNLVAQLVQRFPDFRYGLSFLNREATFIELPAEDADLDKHNLALVDTLLNYSVGGSTPLLRALDRAGQYFYGKLAGKESPIVQSCAANYTVALTDGYWNDYTAGPRNYNGLARGDIDRDGLQFLDRTTTLADVARFYFTRDLAPDLDDDFEVAKNSCESVPSPDFQHVSTIGVAFGPFGNLSADNQRCWPSPALAVDDVWGGNPLQNNAAGRLARIDDLWHAAYNSNGYFASSADPAELLDELSAIFQSASQLNSSGTRGTLASSKLDSDNIFVVSTYDTRTNEGSLSAYPTDPVSGSLSSTPQWSTPTQSNNFKGNQRQLFGYNPDLNAGSYLSRRGASTLSEEQLALLFPVAAKGEREALAQEWLDTLLDSPLGATVHSNPTFVGQPSRFKSLQAEEVRAGYQEFQARQKSRLKRDMVYVGSNRGLLHGYDMFTGEEIFTYLPDALLNEGLTRNSAAYVSSFDGQITAEDAVINGDWRTVIVAGFRLGASGYVAIDVTDPDRFTSPSANEAVLWEYSNEGSQPKNNALLGFSYSKAAIGRMANGKWAAIFGNGYNSESGKAALFILDLESGKELAVIDTGFGPERDPSGKGQSNGLAEPALVDADQDGIVDYIYAGDFYGNLFAFDVTSANENSWESKFGNAQRATPLYTAGAPITARPAVIRYLGADDLMVISATGQNITTRTTTTHAIFGVRDQGAPVTQDLHPVALEGGSNGWSLKQSERDGESPYNGWIIPLTGPASGYQVTTQPLIELGELTVLLGNFSTEVCGPLEGSSALLKMNPLSGGSLNRGLFLDDQFRPRVNGDTPVDGFVAENVIINDLTLAGTAKNNVAIGNTSNGTPIAIPSTTPPTAQGRQRFRRIYD